MTRWLCRIASQMTLHGVPARRRHFYFLALLFLTAAAANQIGIEFENGTSLADSADAQELIRLHEMAVTARSLYE